MREIGRQAVPRYSETGFGSIFISLYKALPLTHRHPPPLESIYYQSQHLFAVCLFCYYYFVLAVIVITFHKHTMNVNVFVRVSVDLFCCCGHVDVVYFQSVCYHICVLAWNEQTVNVLPTTANIGFVSSMTFVLSLMCQSVCHHERVWHKYLPSKPLTASSVPTDELSLQTKLGSSNKVLWGCWTG